MRALYFVAFLSMFEFGSTKVYALIVSKSFLHYETVTIASRYILDHRFRFFFFRNLAVVLSNMSAREVAFWYN